MALAISVSFSKFLLSSRRVPITKASAPASVKVVVDKKDAGEIAAHVKEFKTDFKKTQYCFDNKLGAYEYVKLR